MLVSIFARSWRHCRVKKDLMKSVHVRQWRRLSSAVALTADRYPEVKRGNYKTITDSHVQFFEHLLGKERVLTDSEDVEPYNVDWLKIVRGSSKVVLKPKTTEEVSAILKFCNAESLAVCPQGGNTGLVGGSVPVFDEVVVSTSLMNNIISFDEISGALVCQAGCVLDTLSAYVQEKGLMIPLDLGAKGSCHIGGNVSTNAGGMRLLRYGSLHGSVLGVEAVKADGEVIDCLSTLKKDNTGYHLKHLFIGSEGTLGLVTKVAIQCPASPRAVNTAFLGLQSFEDVLQTFKDARSGLGEILSSCEMMDAAALNGCVNYLKLRNPISDFPFYMMIETSGSNSQHDEEKLSQFLERSMENGTVQDGTVATEPSRVKPMWELRDGITAALLVGHGYVYKYDISLPHNDYYSIVPEMTKRLEGHVKCVCGYGHIGDGNLHLNVSSTEFDRKVHNMIEPYVFEWTSKLRGSISAEHGIGFKKTKYIHYSKSESSVNLMINIKKMMDPKGILNPYKVLPF